MIPSVLIRMLIIWYVLFWLNVFWSECLDSLTTLEMLYVSETHERDGREEALCVTYLLAVTGHVVSEHQNPCQVNFLAAVGAQGLQNDDRQ